MKNSLFNFCLLFVCVTNLCIAEKVDTSHKQVEDVQNVRKQAKKLAQHNTDFFTGVQPSNEFDFSDTLTAFVVTTNTANGLPEIVYGNPETAKVKMTVYSAATCTHCAAYDNEIIPQLMKLVQSGDLLLVLRPFIAHTPWDLVAAKISWVKGQENQHKLFGKILREQDKWLKPAMYEADSSKAAYENQLNDALVVVSKKTGMTVEEIKAKLSIQNDDQAGLLKVFAITDLELNIDDIQKMFKDKDFEQKILSLTLDARNGDKLVNFTPAIYVQKRSKNVQESSQKKNGLGVLQLENLEYDAVATLIEEVKIEEAKNNI